MRRGIDNMSSAEREPLIGEKLSKTDEFFLSIRSDLILSGLRGATDFSRVIVPTDAGLVTIYVALLKHTVADTLVGYWLPVFLVPPILLLISLCFGLLILQPMLVVCSLEVPADISNFYAKIVARRYWASRAASVFLGLGILAMFLVLMFPPV